MSAEAFNGVTLGGAANRFTIINQSTKPILGYAHQPTPINRISPTQTVVDVGSLAMEKLIQPGEERALWLVAPLRVARMDGSFPSEEEITGLALMGVLFADGTFYGPDSIISDFSSMISFARSLARDTQAAARDKYRLLEQYKNTMTRALLDALRNGAPIRPGTSQDLQKVELRVQMSNALLWIRDSKGDEEVDAALARIAALPLVVKGE